MLNVCRLTDLPKERTYVYENGGKKDGKIGFRVVKNERCVKGGGDSFVY